MELSLHQLSHYPADASRLGPHIFPGTLSHTSACSFFCLRDQLLHPYCRTTSTIILLFLLISVFVKKKVLNGKPDILN